MSDPLTLPVACVTDSSHATPQPIDNAAGQPALNARIGTQPQFLSALLDDVAHSPALDGMRISAGDDPTLGLLDAWAMVLDILTFYQERIVNEGYIGTATERRSLLELARTIGYELAPGVATDALLAFTLDAAAAQAGVPGTAERMRFDAGLAAQSIPSPGEKPQTFETLEPMTADVRWNAIAASQTAMPPMGTSSTYLYVEGLQGDLKSGDLLLLAGKARRDNPESDQWDVRELEIVTLEPSANRTRLQWRAPLGSVWPRMAAADPNDALEVWALLGKASLFGAHAPDVRSLHRTVQSQYEIADGATEWPKFTINGDHGGSLAKNGGGGTIQIEGAPPLVVGQWLMLQVPGYRELYRVTAAVESGVVAFTLTAKTTKATLSGENLEEKFNDRLRATTAFFATRRMAVVEGPDASAIEGAAVLLDRIVEGLQPGQQVAVSEALPPAVPGGPPATTQPGENCIIKTVTVDKGRSLVTFETVLSRPYARAAFRLHGNVARASNGLTVEQVLGSGEASASFQQFTLKQVPLTYISAETASGRSSTLEVRVNRILWQEVGSLLGQAADARIYITRRADDGMITILFGDGKSGARLPTGRENVTARYRVGIGTGGLVRDRQILLLLSRPLGLSGIFNPAPSTGGEDPESREDARINAPGTVLTLDRIVSLRDFEDFARVFAGIGRARVDRVWTGRDWCIHLTVASVTGEPLPPGHSLLRKLTAAIDAVRDTTQPLVIADHSARPVTLALKLLEEDGMIHDDVAAALHQRLTATLDHSARQLGDPLTLSDVVLLAHRVPGVSAVDIDVLKAGSEDGVASGGLTARPARTGDDGALLPAELLYLNSCTVTAMLP